QLPRGIGERSRPLAALSGVWVVGGSGDDTSHDPLGDRGEPEHREADVELPVLDAGASRAPAVRSQVPPFSWDTERGQVPTFEAVHAVRAQMVGHAVVGEVAQRMTERRQLPVEDRDDAWLGRMDDHVAEAIVAVSDRRRVVGWNVLGEPRDESL